MLMKWHNDYTMWFNSEKLMQTNLSPKHTISTVYRVGCARVVMPHINKVITFFFSYAIHKLRRNDECE